MKKMKNLSVRSLRAINYFVLFLLTIALSSFLFSITDWFKKPEEKSGSASLSMTYLDKQSLLDTISRELSLLQTTMLLATRIHDKEFARDFFGIDDSVDSIQSSLGEYSKGNLMGKEKDDLNKLSQLVSDYTAAYTDLEKTILSGSADSNAIFFSYTDLASTADKINFALDNLQRDWISNLDDLIEDLEQQNSNKEYIIRSVLIIVGVILFIFETWIMDAIAKAARREKPPSWPADI